MIKTIKIDNKKSFKIDNNIGWMLVYRNQFNHDILVTLMPAISSMVKLVADSIDGVVVDGKINLKSIGPDAWDEALIQLSGLQITDLLEVTWAMAKCADDSIESEPLEWLKTLPAFPMDVIVPQVAEAIMDGCVSSKNSQRIRKAIQSLKNPLASTQSSLPVSNEE